MSTSAIALAFTLAGFPPVTAAALSAEPCRPVHDVTAAEVIRGAISATGLESVGAGVRISHSWHVADMKFQSDRMYPPYLFASWNDSTAVDWRRGILSVGRAFGPTMVRFMSDSVRDVAITPRGTIVPPPRTPGSNDDRMLDPWIVLADWRSALDARVTGQCVYRDYWRTVLTRTTPEGEERLFVDPRTGFPVKVERREPHFLWGDVLVEYLWNVWTPVGNSRALAPRYAFRMMDGEVVDQRHHESYALVPADSVPPLTLPADAMQMPSMQFTTPDTVRVSDNTWLLVTRAYTNVVTLQRDTVFILDAQTSGERAHQDSLWIGRLFPGRHPIVLVVSDLAWPHIAGVRYWVANGATVVSHRASRDFLAQVIDRRWTLEPDLLERRRATNPDAVAFRFRAVDTGMDLAGGAIQVRPIDGIGSEGGLMAYLPGERFLYAGDYIQPGGPGSFSEQYAREVAAAVQRSGFDTPPARFAAMHTPLTPWDSLPRFTGRR